MLILDSTSGLDGAVCGVSLAAGTANAVDCCTDTNLRALCFVHVRRLRSLHVTSKTVDSDANTAIVQGVPGFCISGSGNMGRAQR
jgi:hypothetical protein